MSTHCSSKKYSIIDNSTILDIEVPTTTAPLPIQLTMYIVISTCIPESLSVLFKPNKHQFS